MTLRMLSRVFAILMALSLISCADGTYEEGLASIQQPITGGRVGGGEGAVLIHIRNANGEVGGCTGALVGPRMFVTAAHCFDNVVGNLTSTSFRASVKVWYTKNGSDFSCISSTGASGTCTAWNLADVRRQPRAYDTDVGKDFAVVRISGSWQGVTTSDYRRLWLGHILLTDEYRQYGAGINDDGTDKQMRYLHDRPDELSANQIKTVGSSARPCMGDSGGPLLFKFGTTTNYVIGLHATVRGTRCSVRDEDFAAHRIKKEDIDLIETLGTCTRKPTYAQCYSW